MLHFRTPDIDDLEMLRAWDREPHVIASDPHETEIWEPEELTEFEDWRVMWIVEDPDGIPFGFLQIIDPQKEPEQYWGDLPEGIRTLDIWIGPPEYLGKGYGTQMMKHAFRWCFQFPEVQEIWIDPVSSNVDAIRFYRRVGFEFVERKMLGKDLCDIHRFSRRNWRSE
ncbi:GNAT family N-acetyltransferase [Pontibacter sp. G13]|uniref:GNAT family N-acetyltransferase n=1 Tax=Pontibacter sp. G13 TaxID=3074898 RepID=UPI00288A6E68|nr:GNAT family N-acetyltransferase [Pontibacter sp. G13]WNJ19025.1 GNAT family N-acetyltransferase [Pontibacter sp. G13]